MKKLYSLLACCALVGTSFAQTRYIDNIFSTVNVTTDLSYGTGILEAGGTQDLKWDLYTPAGDTKTDRAMIIIAHGGSLIADYGDKNDEYIKDFANAMAKKGFVVAAITYREGWAFSPINTQEQNSRAIIPAVWRAIQDYKTAIRFFKKSVAVGGNPYGINSEYIVGGGFGVGGYLPMNAMLIDVPAEIKIPELQQKNAFNQPNGTPYIDTTKADLGGIYSQVGGSAGYSYRLELVLNISGAIATTKEFDQGVNPLIISVHADQDEATPYKTDVVQAAGIFPVIQVSGSYVVTNELFNRGINTFWQNETRDGYKSKQDPLADYGTMYTRGLYTFSGRPYMWSTTTDTYNATYETQYRTEMDTVVAFSAYRIEKWLKEKKGVGIKEVQKHNDGLVKVFPNPASDILTLQSTEKGKLIREVEFFDINGRMVKNVMVIDGDAKIDVESLTTGVYTMKMYFDDSIVTDKVVIK